jgi:hypothetical protein
MKYQLTQQQFKNLTAAVNFWLKVPRDTVKRGLETWSTPQGTGRGGYIYAKPTCGAAACFGGWLPYSPYFERLGVTPRSENEAYPVLRVDGVIKYDSKDVAEQLFGERELFASKYYWHVDRALVKEMGENASDWGLVLMRLAYVLENVELITNPV